MDSSARCCQARGAALAGLQHVLDAVLQGLALGARAVPLRPAAARAQQHQEQGIPRALLPAPGPGHRPPQGTRLQSNLARSTLAAFLEGWGFSSESAAVS